MNFKTFLMKEELKQEVNEEQVMNALFFNFFCFIGLIKLNSNSAAIKKYQTADKNVLSLKSITDENTDVETSIKIASENKFIKLATATKMVKMLQLIRSKQFDNDKLTEANIRELLDEIRYATNKPGTRVYQVVKDFHDGTISLPIFTKRMYVLAKQKEFAANSIEFRNLVINGHFIKLFNELSDTDLEQDAKAEPKVSNKEKLFNALANVYNKNDIQDALSAANVTTLEQVINVANEMNKWAETKSFDETDFFIKMALKREMEFMRLLKIKNSVNSFYIEDSRVVTTLGSDVSSIPFYETVVSLTNIVINCVLEKSTDINLILELFRKIPRRILESLREKNKDSGVLKQLEQIYEIFLSFIETSDFSYNSFKNIQQVYDEIRYQIIDEYYGLSKFDLRTYNPKYFGTSFNKRTVVYVLKNFFTISDINKKISLYSFLKDAFPTDIGATDNLEISLDDFNKATKENKVLFKALIDRGLARTIDTSISVPDEIYKALIKTDYNSKLTNDYVARKITEKEIEEIQAKLEPGNYSNIISNIRSNSIFRGILLEKISPIVIHIFKTVKNDVIKDQIDFYDFLNYFDIKTIQKIFDTIDNNVVSINTILDEFRYINSSTDISILINLTLTNMIIRLANEGKFKIKSLAFFTNFFKLSKTPNPIIIHDLVSFIPLYEELMERINNFYFEKAAKTGLRYISDLIKTNDNLKKYLLDKFAKVININDYSTNYFNMIDDSFIDDNIINHFKEKIFDTIDTSTVMRDVDLFKLQPKIQNAFFDYVKDLDEEAKKSKFNLYTRTIIPIKDKRISGKYLESLCTEFIYDETAQMKSKSSIMHEIIMMFTRNELDYKAFLTFDNKKLIEFFDFFINKTGIMYGSEEFLMNSFSTIKRYDENKFDLVFGKINESLTKEMRKKVIKNILSSEFAFIARDNLFRGDDLIKPYEKINDKNLIDIMNYNKINVNVSNYDKMINSENINSAIIRSSKKIEKLNVTQIDKSQENLDRKTIELNVFNKFKHGRIAPKVLREFDVNISKQQVEYDNFIKEFPNTKIMDPVFHGTGSIAASMILRYGFSIIHRASSSVTGRMLGDGIYFSNVIDKVSQYVADTGYTRGIGNKGYIFQMKAALGEHGKHYRDGSSSKRHLVSPEWCVYFPNKQLQIYKAYEVELINKYEIDKLKEQYRVNEVMTEIVAFKQFLQEMVDTEKNAITFVFMDGNIPVSKDKFVPFEKFVPNRNTKISYSQLGPIVTIFTDEESSAYCVKNTTEFMSKENDLSYFLTLLKGR